MKYVVVLFPERRLLMVFDELAEAVQYVAEELTTDIDDCSDCSRCYRIERVPG